MARNQTEKFKVIDTNKVSGTARQMGYSILVTLPYRWRNKTVYSYILDDEEKIEASHTGKSAGN